MNQAEQDVVDAVVASLKAENRRLRKLANRRARKCNAFLAKLREARRWHSVTDNDRRIAERERDSARSERDALAAQIEKVKGVIKYTDPAFYEIDAIFRTDAIDEPKHAFYGIDAQQEDQDAWKTGNEPKPTEPETVTISFEELVGACGVTKDPVIQAQLAKCRTCGGNGLTSGRCWNCGAGKDLPNEFSREFMIFTYDRNSNIIAEEKFTGTDRQVQSQVAYLCDVSKREDAAGYIQAFSEPVDYDKNGQPYGEPAYYRRV